MVVRLLFRRLPGWPWPPKPAPPFFCRQGENRIIIIIRQPLTRAKRETWRDDPHPAAASGGAVAGGGGEADDAPVSRRRGDREAGVGGVVPERGRRERRGRGEAGPDGARGGDGRGEGGRDELLRHGVELGEEVLQIPHLALAGVGGCGRLLGARRGVVGGGLDDGHRSRKGGREVVGGFWKVRERMRRRSRGEEYIEADRGREVGLLLGRRDGCDGWIAGLGAHD